MSSRILIRSFDSPSQESRYQDNLLLSSAPLLRIYFLTVASVFSILFIKDLIAPFPLEKSDDRQFVRLFVIVPSAIFYFGLLDAKGVTPERINRFAIAFLSIILVAWLYNLIVLNTPWTTESLTRGVILGSIFLLITSALTRHKGNNGIWFLSIFYLSFVVISLFRGIDNFDAWFQWQTYFLMAYCVSILIYISVNAQERRLFLAREQLQQKRDELEKQKNEIEAANNRKNQFLDAIGHDFRQPMTAIQLYQESASRSIDKLPTDQVRQFIDGAQRSASSLVGHFDRWFDLSKIDRLSTSDALEPVDIRQQLDQVAELYQSTAQVNEIALDYLRPASLVMAQTEPALIAVVLRNLVGNAVRYHRSEQHDRQVRLSIALSDRHIRLFINDNGVGIHPKEMARIFERGFRSPTAPSGGYGLGLALVRDSIDRLPGHKIRFRSDGSTYTCVMMVLPYSKS